MKPLLLFILFFWGQLQLTAQSSLPTLTVSGTDSLTFIQYLPINTDFVLAYSEESYWWANTENFKLLLRTDNQWSAWTYYRKWKSSSDMFDNNGMKEKKYFMKVAIFDPMTVKELFDSLNLINFWTLQTDSLNETRGVDISDNITYKFQIESLTGRQGIESYAPEYYVDRFPDMYQRILFLHGKEIFLRWWEKHCR